MEIIDKFFRKIKSTFKKALTNILKNKSRKIARKKSFVLLCKQNRTRTNKCVIFPQMYEFDEWTDCSPDLPDTSNLRNVVRLNTRLDVEAGDAFTKMDWTEKWGRIQ